MQLCAWFLLATVMAVGIPLPSTTDSNTHSQISNYNNRPSRAVFPTRRQPSFLFLLGQFFQNAINYNKRPSRAVFPTRRQPSFLFLLGQFFGQTISETNQAVGNITKIFNDQFTTTTPSPDTVMEDSNSTTPSPPISRQQLFAILGNNYKGLTRLFNQEWSSAIQQSSKNIASFRKEFREAVRPFFSPNKNNTRNQS